MYDPRVLRRKSVSYESSPRLLDLHLVLDLDDTLLRTLHMPEFEMIEDKENLAIPDIVDYKDQMFVYFRPYLRDFLKWAFTNCKTVSVFTYANAPYAKWIVESLFGHKFFLVFSRESCIPKENACIKPLEHMWCTEKAGLMGMDATNTIIIDDIPMTFEHNPSNGLQIDGYHPLNQDDMALMNMIPRIVQRYEQLHVVKSLSV